MKKLVSFWKQVKEKSSDMFTLFRVGIGVKVPTHKFHVKDKTDPIKIEGLQNDTTDPDKFLTIDASNVVKYRTGAQVLTDVGGTPLTTEEVQDISGALVATGGTKTGIAVTYQDGTGDVDFVVDHDTATNFTADEHFTQASITTVGTIGTGVWEGTTIKTAFIGDDQVTEDKLADTLLAEIDANTLKNTNVVGDLTITAAGHKLQLNTTNGVDVSLPLATTDAWGVMSDEMFDEHTANNAKVSNIVQTTITGNAGTATALVDGNQTITGTLTVNASSSTGNPLLTFTQNGTRRAFIQLADNSGGYTNNLRISSEYGAITLGAASTNGVDSDTAYLTVEPTGIFKFGAVDSDAVLTTDGNMTFRIDADNDETSQKFSFENNASTEIASLDESGDLMLTGNIELGNASDTTIARSGAGVVTIEGAVINTQSLTIKILPSDFMPDDGGRPAMIDDTSGDRWLESHGTLKLFAFVHIPSGFKATDVYIYGSATSAVTVYEADINSATVTSKGTGNIGTSINITDVTADTTNYIMIELAQASGERVYGGKMTIAAV